MQQRRQVIKNRHKSVFIIDILLARKERERERIALEATDCLQYYICLLMCDVT